MNLVIRKKKVLLQETWEGQLFLKTLKFIGDMGIQSLYLISHIYLPNSKTVTQLTK